MEELDRLVTHIAGDKDSEIVVCIPSGTSMELLKQHLEILSRQTRKDFDILIIGSVPTVVPEGLNIIAYSENAPLGSAGGFGIGQILGYELGYKFIMNADVDCFPMDDTLIETLVRKAQETGKIAAPHGIHSETEPRDTKDYTYTINGYACVPREVFDRIGFEFIRFFRGGEDAEYNKRMVPETVHTGEAMVTHPFSGQTIIEKMNGGAKYLFYQRSILMAHIYSLYYCLSRKDFKGALGSFLQTVLWNMYFLPFSVLRCNRIGQAVLDGTSLDYGVDYAKYKDLEKVPYFEPVPNMRVIKLDVWKPGMKPEPYTVYFKDTDMAKMSVDPKDVFGKIMKIRKNRFHYLQPSQEFYKKYGFLYPYLMMTKPILHEGKCYNWRVPWNYALLGFFVAVMALPVVLAFIVSSLIQIRMQGDFPPKPSNVRKMLGYFCAERGIL